MPYIDAELRDNDIILTITMTQEFIRKFKFRAKTELLVQVVEKSRGVDSTWQRLGVALSLPEFVDIQCEATSPEKCKITGANLKKIKELSIDGENCLKGSGENCLEINSDTEIINLPMTIKDGFYIKVVNYDGEPLRVKIAKP
jgi:hypothetical protein